MTSAKDWNTRVREPDAPRTCSKRTCGGVWTLRALFDSPLSADLTFKDGTSVSKVYKIINRWNYH